MEENTAYFKKAFFIREFENFLIALFKKGELNGTVHTCVGQELTPVVLSSFLKQGDRIFSNHRGHGHFLSFGGDTRRLLSEMLGLETGVSGGIGGSQHLMNANFISNGIQGGMTAIGAGYGYINKLKGNDNIAVVFLGDGTLGEGALYEALNLSAVFSSQVVYVLEHNRYAQSTSHKQTFRGDIRKRAEGFGLKYSATNIWDIEHLQKTLSSSVSDGRQGIPSFVEVDCYRINSHSKGDDNRTNEEVEEYIVKDLLYKYKEEHSDCATQFINEARQELHTIYDDCKKDKQLSTMKKHSYIFSNNYVAKPYQPEKTDEEARINKLIYYGLKDILEHEENALLIGEDIENVTEFTGKEYGGAFKVTQDLSDIFKEKVHNTPISEAGIIGFGIGAALNGYRAIVEIMFGDFLTLGFDQLLQQASKIPEMYGRKVELPLIIRTPMGGRRGYGPTHSQNIEKHFLFIPNIEVIALNSVMNPRWVYNEIHKHNKTTTLVIEDKIGYTKFLNAYKVKGYTVNSTDEAYPTLIFEPVSIKPNCTLFVYGGMLDEVLGVLEQLVSEDVFPTIICPTRICPLNIGPLVNALGKSEKLLFIEEGSKFGGLSSEIIAWLAEHDIRFKLKKRMSNESLIPCARIAESNSIPNSRLILAALTEE